MISGNIFILIHDNRKMIKADEMNKNKKPAISLIRQTWGWSATKDSLGKEKLSFHIIVYETHLAVGSPLITVNAENKSNQI